MEFVPRFVLLRLFILLRVSEMRKSIILSGVGGQGILTLGRILGETLLDKGFEVRVGEIHGLSQRGGSVIAFVRYGNKVYAPTVSPGEGDAMVSLELLEALRRIEYLSPKGLLVVNDLILPPPMSKNVPSRKEVLDFLSKTGLRYIVIDGLGLAEKAGSPLSLNIVMLGALLASGVLDISVDDVARTIEKTFSERVAEINIRALNSGYEAAKKMFQ